MFLFFVFYQNVLYKKENRNITNLKEDIYWLSGELQKKDSLLSSFMEVAYGQSKHIALLSSAIHDTVLWGPVHLSLSFLLLNSQPLVVMSRFLFFSPLFNQGSPLRTSLFIEGALAKNVVVAHIVRRGLFTTVPPRVDLMNCYPGLCDEALAHLLDASPTVMTPPDWDLSMRPKHWITQLLNKLRALVPCDNLRFLAPSRSSSPPEPVGKPSSESDAAASSQYSSALLNITIISSSPLLPHRINSWGTCVSLMES